jgi:predicted amidophosphoribosyltransferase
MSDKDCSTCIGHFNVLAMDDRCHQCTRNDHYWDKHMTEAEYEDERDD